MNLSSSLKTMAVMALLTAALSVQLSPAVAMAATCSPTGFYRDGINMTAALINPSGTVSGEVNATGCNIGIYYDQSGAVDNAVIYGSNYFGVLVNGDLNNPTVTVTNSQIHDIGESPLNGTQHGVGIYYRGFGTGTASGTITGNTVTHYQKGGIVANGAGTTATIQSNTVTGEGAISYIAQNGIQVGYGAHAQVKRNTVSGNSYAGNWGASSGGIIVVGGPGYDGPFTVGTVIQGNSVTRNDVGIWLSNLQADYSAPATQTNIQVVNNTISNDELNNLSGNGYPYGYQAGIADQGKGDKLINNRISGAGYDPSQTQNPNITTQWIDANPLYTNNAKVHANTVK